MSITAKEILSTFIDGDHFRIGLDKGRTLHQIMKLCGYKNPEAETLKAYKDRSYTTSNIQTVKKMLDRDGFTMDSIKLSKKPTVYFIVEPGSMERVNHHGKLVRRSTNADRKVKNSRLLIHKELEKLPVSASVRKQLVQTLAQKA